VAGFDVPHVAVAGFDAPCVGKFCMPIRLSEVAFSFTSSLIFAFAQQIGLSLIHEKTDWHKKL